MSKAATLGRLSKSVQIIRRSLEPAAPGSAEPRHAYRVVFTAHVDVRTKTGDNAFAQVVIDGKAASHVFTMRYTTLKFDTRDRVRDARGNLYRIISVENVNLDNKSLRIYAAAVGSEDVEAAI